MSKIVSLDEYLSLPREPETWLIEPLLPIGGSALLYGDAKIGKSFAALQLAEALCKGSEWLTFRCRQSKVVYIQLDTPRSLWAHRIESLRRSGSLCNLSGTPPIHELVNHETGEIFPYPSQSTTPKTSPSRLLLADRETLDTWPFDILSDEHQVLLKTTLDLIGPDVVIIDTLREAHSGDENDSTAMQNVIARLTAAVKPAALVLISHARKAGQDSSPDLISDNRGSNYVVGRMDAIIRFSWTSMRVSGRAIDEQSIAIHRADNGFWELSEDPLKLHADTLLREAEGQSVRELARLLHDRSGKSESACRAYLRRRLAGAK